jgi:hypothetical protein
MTFTFILLAILVYVATYLIVRKDVETRIKGYSNETIWKEGIVDNALVAKLRNNKKTIIIFGAIAWPLYYLFCVGAAFGSDIYDLLMGDNYENRIATWFI